MLRSIWRRTGINFSVLSLVHLDYGKQSISYRTCAEFSLFIDSPLISWYKKFHISLAVGIRKNSDLISWYKKCHISSCRCNKKEFVSESAGAEAIEKKNRVYSLRKKRLYSLRKKRVYSLQLCFVGRLPHSLFLKWLEFVGVPRRKLENMIYHAAQDVQAEYLRYSFACIFSLLFKRYVWVFLRKKKGEFMIEFVFF